jgi:hypothetical protein
LLLAVDCFFRCCLSSLRREASTPLVTCDCLHARHLSLILLRGRYENLTFSELSARVAKVKDNKPCPHILVAPRVLDMLTAENLINPAPMLEQKEPSIILLRERPGPVLASVLISEDRIRATVAETRVKNGTWSCTLCRSRKTCVHIQHVVHSLVLEKNSRSSAEHSSNEAPQDTKADVKAPVLPFPSPPVAARLPSALRPRPTCSCPANTHGAQCTWCCASCQKSWQQAREEKVIGNWTD